MYIYNKYIYIYIIRNLIIFFSFLFCNYSTYVSIFFFLVVLHFLFLFCVFCIFVLFLHFLCIFFLLCCLSPIFVPLYRPLPSAGNQLQ